MNIDVGLRIAVADDLDLNALAQEIAEAADAIEGARVAAHSQAIVDQSYTIVGVVKGKPAEQWVEVVYAENEADARAKAEDAAPEGTERSVAAVMAGDQSAAVISDPAEP